MIGHIKSGQYQKNIARTILKKYCPPCHKARGIHDFILATKSPVWIIIYVIYTIGNNVTHVQPYLPPKHLISSPLPGKYDSLLPTNDTVWI